jgi:glutaredoxin
MNSKNLAASNQDQALSLYYYDGCPFCHMTLKTLDQIKQDSAKDGELKVELRHIRRQPQHRTELIKKGGKPQVPCLRIDGSDGKTKWLYESRDIIQYMRAYSLANKQGNNTSFA